MPNPLKLYMCLGHGLTMCILFGYNPQIIFVTFSQNELSCFSGQSEYILGILCMQLFLHFCADSFETLQMFRSWSEAVHICHFFHKLNLVIYGILSTSVFTTKATKEFKTIILTT